MDENAALRDLCARIFWEPERLVSVFARRLDAPLHQGVHQHRDLLQLDLTGGCAGSWLGKTPRSMSRVTATVFYPRVSHGYDVLPRTNSAYLFSLKVRVESSWPALKRRAFPAHVTNISGEGPLVKSLWRLARLFEHRSSSALLPATFSEVVALWPQQAQPMLMEPLESDPLVDQALRLIDAHIAEDITVEDLARAVHLSPRQLGRRIRAQLGCAPQSCITARRVGRARELLSTGDVSITQAAEFLGFASIHTFSRWFRQGTGVAPSAWRSSPPL